MSGLPEDCHFLIFDRLSTEEKLLARGVCQEWRSVIEDLLAKQTSLSTRLPNLVRNGLYWSPCGVVDHKRSPSNTIRSEWKAMDLQKLVTKYFYGLKALFVYNVKFCASNDLNNFINLLRDLVNLEHLEFAFCSCCRSHASVSKVYSNNLVATPKLAHFAAVRNFSSYYHNNLLEFLMTSVNSTKLTMIILDTYVGIKLRQAWQRMIAANPVEDFQIVEGPPVELPRLAGRPPPVPPIRIFHEMITGVSKIKKLARFDNYSIYSSNSSVKELSVNCWAKADLFKGLIALNWINKMNASGIFAVTRHGHELHAAVQQTNLSSYFSPEVLPNLIKFRIGLMAITENNLLFICNRLQSLEHLAIGSLDGLLEDGSGKIQMDMNIHLNSELVQISSLEKLSHLELNFTGITDDILIILLDTLKSLKVISLIGCYQLRAVDTIFEGRNLTVIRSSTLLKNIQLMTKEEVTGVRIRRQAGFFDAKRCEAILKSEISELDTNPPPHWSIGVEPNDQLTWNATFIGPENTIYSEVTFMVIIKLTKGYPNVAPVIRFTSDIFHPNFIRNKNVELDVLKKDHWTSAMSVEMVLIEIFFLLVNPNLDMDKVINHEAAHLYENAKPKFIHRTRQLFKFNYVPKLIVR